MSRRIVLPLFWTAFLAPVIAWACEYVTVRDAAFQEPRDIHRLVLFTREGDEGVDPLETRMRDWLTSKEGTVNLELRVVDVESESVDWSEFGIPGPPPSTPVTALIGTNNKERRSFFIRHWEPAPTEEELVGVVSSPFREGLREKLLNQVGVIVHVPGNNPKRDDLEGLLAGIETEWDEKEKAGISRVTLDRNDPDEEMVLSFLGIPPDGPDWVGVLFGRGKAMDPWTGADINESELNGQLETLIGECSCLTTASGLGVDLPMVWTEEMDSQMEFLREPLDDEDTVALAGVRNSPMGGGPTLVLGLLFGSVLVFGIGLFVVRSRRQAGPLVTHSGR
ncbi:MAG: hypothetical protein KC917_18590 [Candidatus Omnitrophica bacterium]|nr:hypothetical protein [Candidatus Omnitrophota bacterium]